jgi:hypothetical protein
MGFRSVPPVVHAIPADAVHDVALLVLLVPNLSGGGKAVFRDFLPVLRDEFVERIR